MIWSLLFWIYQIQKSKKSFICSIVMINSFWLFIIVNGWKIYGVPSGKYLRYNIWFVMLVQSRCLCQCLLLNKYSGKQSLGNIYDHIWSPHLPLSLTYIFTKLCILTYSLLNLLFPYMVYKITYFVIITLLFN